MKILFISGGYDYHAVMFEQSKYSVQDIVTLCEASVTKTVSIDEEETFFDAELFEFGEVDPKFIDFIKSKQDYDDAKHSNWYIVPAKINNYQTSLIEVVEYSDFSTVGELKQILSTYPDNLSFGFSNQPFQNLHHIRHKDNSFECLCFQELFGDNS